jgi:hypothetical protein
MAGFTQEMIDLSLTLPHDRPVESQHNYVDENDDADIAAVAEHLRATVLPVAQDPTYAANLEQYAREYVRELKSSGAIDPGTVTAALAEGRPDDVLVAYDQLIANQVAAERLRYNAAIEGRELDDAALEAALAAAGAVPVTAAPGVTVVQPIVGQAFPPGSGRSELPTTSRMILDDSIYDPGNGGGGGQPYLPTNGGGGGGSGGVSPLPGGGGGGGGTIPGVTPDVVAPVIPSAGTPAISTGVLVGVAALAFYLLRRRG